jgi:hypothetical protein
MMDGRKEGGREGRQEGRKDKRDGWADGRKRGREEGKEETGQVLLEPDARLEVQVVGRFVEKKEGGCREQGLGQGHAHPPPAAHVLCLAVHGNHGVVEAEASEDETGPRLRTCGVQLIETFKNRLETFVLRPIVFNDVL